MDTARIAPPKPRLALAIATCFGLGYIPKAPGTAGSLAGIAVAFVPWGCMLLLVWKFGGFGMSAVAVEGTRVTIEAFVFCGFLMAAFVAGMGVWTSGRAASYFGKKDPSQVIIDEVSGQHLTYLLGGFSLFDTGSSEVVGHRHLLSAEGFFSPSWKYLLLGFILFRVFDIWKPWPVRQAERLPRGWGIMADDWVAGIYAALGLWLARALGL